MFFNTFTNNRDSQKETPNNLAKLENNVETLVSTLVTNTHLATPLLSL